MRTLLAAGCMAGIALIGTAAPVYADNTTHNNNCQSIEANGGGTPGNSATSPGSVFNEGGINSPLGGTGGQAYNSARQGAGAPSQYDTACAKTTANGTATPMQTSMSPTQIKNNSIATRNATGVVSHTGKG
ncbi:hypothetical protein [Mycolicibacterium brisbanense]